MPSVNSEKKRVRPTQDPNEAKKSPTKPKPEPEPAIPEGRCNLHPSAQHKAKDCPGLENNGSTSEGYAPPDVVPLGLKPREEDPPEDDQPGDQGNLLRVLSTDRVQLDLFSRSVRRT